MSFHSLILIAIIGLLSLTSNAHLFISSPVPIQGSAPKDPLDASGSNFPCHGVSLPSSGGQKMAAGSSQLLAFELGGGANTAVHGGGSCQISITYETDAAKIKDPKNWHVISSIEGGCPSNTHQNLDGSYQGPQGTYTGALACSDPKTNGVDCVNSFNFTIPSGMKAGAATLAWTWFNTVGNREMYMNCVSIDIEGGDGSEMSGLPSMFVANLQSVDTCPTTQSVDLQFPYPGKYVTTKKPSGEAAKTAVTFPMAQPTGSGCATDGGTSGGKSSSAGSASPNPSYGAASAARPASVTQATSAANSAASSDTPLTITTMATVTGSAPTSVAAPSAVAPAASAAPASSSAASSNTSENNSCANSAVSCTSPGEVICIGSDQFGLCDSNKCAIPQALAAGTRCSNGAIVKRAVHPHALRHVAGRRVF
ncbi:hypothetical protein B0A50_03496 [Salinomyces thailandicus]|uniref:Lytic polysaccharide monooxygenase n=1 Tax=Salinomyces thailandicus TaxID=706561 RepID=A0A4U0U392_9PEZI|nr:hypothetical protein B0A50_03496 [Salinomyces thailandica]